MVTLEKYISTTAKITLAHGLIYDTLLRRFGEGHARLYLNAQINAIKEYTRLCRDVDCDFEQKDAFVYSLRDLKKIENEMGRHLKNGAVVEYTVKPVYTNPVSRRPDVFIVRYKINGKNTQRTIDND